MSVVIIVLFLGTLSFLFTTPGVVASYAGGIPVLSGQPGQFLLKDLVLIGVAIWTLGESLTANTRAYGPVYAKPAVPASLDRS